MRLRPDQLESHLGKTLLTAYLITGDELLLCQEAADKIRKACRQAGILERDVLEVDRHFDWSQLLESGQSLSLFGDRKLIELRLGNGKMDQKSSAALQEYLAHADGSNILLISSGRLDKRSLGAKWVKALEDNGAVIQIWPVERRQLGQWIGQRLSAAGLNADREAAELLADRVEGNLLAADQEIQKLRVLMGERAIDAETVAAAVTSSARYDVFKLIDTALSGNTAQSLRILQSLMAEGSEQIAMLGAVSAELRKLYNCAEQLANGHGIDRVLDGARVWDKKKALYKQALRRLKLPELAALMQLAARSDSALEGQSDDDGSQLMQQLVTRLSGAQLLRDGEF